MKTPVFHSPSLRLHLGNWGDVGDGGRLRLVECVCMVRQTPLLHVCELALPTVLGS